MRCPKCGGSKSSVIDSRQAEDGNTIRRRRECEDCQHRFTTYERVEERTLVVVKKDGTREQFSRDKIFNGIIRSAQKRPVSSDEIEALGFHKKILIFIISSFIITFSTLIFTYPKKS